MGMKRFFDMKVGIIGLGHIGKALIAGWTRSGFPKASLLVNAKTEQSMKHVKNEYPGVRVLPDKRELVSSSDVVVVAVRPGDAAEVLGEIGRCDCSGRTIVSLMAGVTFRDMKTMMGDDSCGARIVRLMPNVGISNGNGVIGICYEDGTPGITFLEDLFGRLGKLVRVTEDGLNDIIVCAGSGLAFAAYFIKEYRNACARLLGDVSVSEDLTRHVFLNAMELTEDGQETLEGLVGKICTRGGTTEAGVNALKESDLSEVLDACFAATSRRIGELLPRD